MDKLGKILIIDDNTDVLLALNLLLEPIAEHVKVIFSPDRLDQFMTDYKPDMILLDMNFTRDTVSGEEGMECLKRIQKRDPNAIVIMMTAYADMDKAVRAIKAGATDFFAKPWENDKLIATLRAAYRLKRNSAKEEDNKRAEESRPAMPKTTLIGKSKCMLDMIATIDKMQQADVNVLLLGENGTGKDVVAHYILEHSARAGKPFVTIDMGAVPDSLFESELFGYAKGAFTDAQIDKPGRMEMADGGTLFLDEVGNLSASAQSKLLTAIEKRRITRVGGTKETAIDVRMICATNAELRQLVADGTFRQDLFYRINTVEIHIPPLRERGDDIQLLADFFLDRFAKAYNKGKMTISEEARRKLQAYSWPGNVRELQHTIERAVVMAADNTLNEGDFLIYVPEEEINVTPAAEEDTQEIFNLADLERQTINKVMELCDGHLSRAADMLGITRYALRRKLEKM